MLFSSLLPLSALPALVYAQGYGYGGGGSNTPASSAPASAPSAPANTDGHMNIDVAPSGQFAFSPANISNVPVGTLVTFFFPAGNNGPHSVTQSSFANPCTYLQANSSSNAPGGFDSGLQSAMTFTINVTDGQPIWFHCKQQGHCGMGMVGSINAPSSGNNTHDNFVKAALAIGGSETLEPDNGFVSGGGVHATPTGAPASSTSSPSGALSIAPSLFTLFAGVVAVVFA